MDKTVLEGLSFEKAIERLETIVKKLESGDTSLEESLTLYEEGIALTRLCAQKIDGAEQKIKMLTTDKGMMGEADFKA